jgi:D-xylose transport system substrate-binding protein
MPSVKTAARLAVLLSASALAAPAFAAGPVIAFLMPCSTCADRFEAQDKPAFVEAIKAIDPTATVIANNAQGSGDAQVSQAEAALTNGAKVIVVSPMTEAAGAAIVAKARADKVPVLSYDGLLTGAPVDFYVSFQNERVGELQAKFMVDNLKPGSTILMVNGSQDAASGRLFKAGSHKAIDPAVASGALKIGYETDITAWTPATAQAETEQALTKLGDKVEGVLVANDGMAGGVIAALTARNLNGKVMVTGQDATDAGLQRILAGDQSMTVYKAIKAEAKAAAEVAMLLARGETDKVKAAANASVDNGAGSVPSVLLEPVAVTVDNIRETVLADGFTTLDRICVGAAKTAKLCAK